MAKSSVLERDILRQCLNYLWRSHVFYYRNNTGAVTRYHRGKARTVHFGVRGGPDIIAVKGGQYVAIECKSPTGKQSKDQKDFQRMIEGAGGRYLLVRSLDDLKAML